MAMHWRCGTCACILRVSAAVMKGTGVWHDRIFSARTFEGLRRAAKWRWLVGPLCLIGVRSCW